MSENKNIYLRPTMFEKKNDSANFCRKNIYFLS